MKRLGTIVLISAVCLSLTFGVIGCAEPPSPPPGGGTTPPSGEEPSLPQVTQTAEVKVLENSIYIQQDEVSLRLNGELQNTGETWAEVIEVTVTFYDERGYLLYKKFIHPEINILSPGQKAPFCFYQRDTYAYAFNPKPYAKYIFEVEQEATSPGQTFEELEILGIETVKFPFDRIDHLEVEVHNKGDSHVLARLVVTYYDSEGRVVDAEHDEEGFAPNKVAAYEVDYSYPEPADYYSLQFCPHK